MKLFLALIGLFYFNTTYSQLYNLIYTEIVDGKIVRDFTADMHSFSFMKAYSGKDYELAIQYIDSIEYIGKGDYRTTFNKAICYTYLNNKDSIIANLNRYFNYANTENIAPGLLKYSALFKTIKTEPELYAKYTLLEKKYCKNITNCELALQIQSRCEKEQEIMMDTAFIGRKNQELKGRLMAENLKPILIELNKNGLPSKKEVGSAQGLLEVLLLHLDYSPKEQYKWAKKMLKKGVKEGEYGIGGSIYAIDRSLKNLGRKQKYGTMIINRGTENSTIYKYQGSLKKLNKRRKKYNLKPIEEEEKSFLINEST